MALEQIGIRTHNDFALEAAFHGIEIAPKEQPMPKSNINHENKDKASKLMQQVLEERKNDPRWQKERVMNGIER